jgi:hypothetical protein
MDGFLRSLGFSKSVVDPNLYYYNVGDDSLSLMTYSEILVVIYKKDMIPEWGIMPYLY